ncbi:S8 family serine peptidase [Actinomycetes bacterium KLBMP 9797]
MRRWCVRLVAAASGLLLVLSPSAVAVAGPDREATAVVDALLSGRSDNAGETVFWVVLRAQADLSGATRLRDRVVKATHVRRALMAHAEGSQAGLRRWLAERGAETESFWITNALRVTGDAALVEELATRSDVSHLLADRRFALPRVAEETARSAEAASVAAVQWNVSRVGADRVWNQFGVRGEGIVVAGIDSGVQYDHPALVNSYRGRRANGTFDHNYNWYTPVSFYCPTAAPCDQYEHGTHTMGTVVGRDADGAHHTGVAPGVKWIAAAGCPFRYCSPQTLLSAGQWALAPTDLNGQNPRPDLAPDVINNSWGENGFNALWQPMVTSWVNAGIFPVFSNGNSGPACGTPGSPGYYSQSYSVGSLDSNDLVSDFSSRGPGENGDVKPDVTAPGRDVLSTLPGGQYGHRSGTSMAAPHVTGSVALLWSAAPALDGDIAATKAALDDAAIDVNDVTCGGSADNNNVYGEGRLDAYAAVSAAPRANLGVLHGQFSSTATAQPLNDVVITLDGPLHRVSVSGMDGGYKFDRLLPGTYTYTLEKWGY